MLKACFVGISQQHVGCLELETLSLDSNRKRQTLMGTL